MLSDVVSVLGWVEGKESSPPLHWNNFSQGSSFSPNFLHKQGYCFTVQIGLDNAQGDLVMEIYPNLSPITPLLVHTASFVNRGNPSFKRAWCPEVLPIKFKDTKDTPTASHEKEPKLILPFPSKLFLPGHFLELLAFLKSNLFSSTTRTTRSIESHLHVQYMGSHAVPSLVW